MAKPLWEYGAFPTLSNRYQYLTARLFQLRATTVQNILRSRI
jgi:hypothetical protein